MGLVRMRTMRVRHSCDRPRAFDHADVDESRQSREVHGEAKSFGRSSKSRLFARQVPI
jgi:hypothetical protein